MFIWVLSSGGIKVENNNSQIPIKDLKRLCNTVESYSAEIIKAWKEKFGVLTFYDEQKKNVKGR